MPDPNFNPVIRVSGLRNAFGTQVVHDGLDMEVRQNEIFGVVGGCEVRAGSEQAADAQVPSVL